MAITAYVPKTFTNGSGEPLSADNLNHIEQGIKTVTDEVNAHTHGSITRDGKIGTTANLPVVTGTGGALETKPIADMKTLLNVPVCSLSGTVLTITFQV